MSLKFKHGRSYIFIFAIFLVLFLGGSAICEAVGYVNWGIITMPAFLTLLLLCELWSGVALDSWWRASYPKGCWQYQAILAWHAVGVVFISAFSYLFIR